MTQRAIVYPSEDFEGLIFDLDGTLIDSMEAHYEAMGQALEEEGGIGLFTKERYSELGGKPAADIVDLLNLENGLSMDARKVCERQQEVICNGSPTFSLKFIRQFKNPSAKTISFEVGHCNSFSLKYLLS